MNGRDAQVVSGDDIRFAAPAMSAEDEPGFVVAGVAATAATKDERDRIDDESDVRPFRAGGHGLKAELHRVRENSREFPNPDVNGVDSGRVACVIPDDIQDILGDGSFVHDVTGVGR